MKIVLLILTFIFCHLMASQFLHEESLGTAFDVPPVGRSVGTIIATNFELDAVSRGDQLEYTTATCFAISRRHFVCGAYSLKQITSLKGCYISMYHEMGFAVEALPMMIMALQCHKVKSVSFEPSGATFAIVTLDEDLDVTPLSLGEFEDNVKTMGISTAYPTLLGNTEKKCCVIKRTHTFVHEGLIKNEAGSLEALFVLKPEVTADVVVKNAILPRQILGACGKYQSMLTNGDDGAPIFQGEHVVAVCNGWNLRAAKLNDEPVHVLANIFTPIAKYRDWISSITEIAAPPVATAAAETTETTAAAAAAATL